MSNSRECWEVKWSAGVSGVLWCVTLGNSFKPFDLIQNIKFYTRTQLWWKFKSINITSAPKLRDSLQQCIKVHPSLGPTLLIFSKDNLFLNLDRKEWVKIIQGTVKVNCEGNHNIVKYIYQNISICQILDCLHSILTYFIQQWQSLCLLQIPI